MIKLSFFGLYTAIAGLLLFSSCSTQYKINHVALKTIAADSGVQTGHWGVSIFDPNQGVYLYQHQANQHFIPASNTKLFSLYAALRYLGDSLPTARIYKTSKGIWLKPMGDPSFLHPDFSDQSLFDWMQQQTDSIYLVASAAIDPLGPGWAWDDFDQDYASERSVFPVLGNQVWLTKTPLIWFNKYVGVSTQAKNLNENWVSPAAWSSKWILQPKPLYARAMRDNIFYIDTPFHTLSIPFVTNNMDAAQQILQPLLKAPLQIVNQMPDTGVFVYSQPTDSMLKLMMHRSDNFFAEQTLVMAAQTSLGNSNTQAIIQQILDKDLTGIPQKPRWVDGSGLSRYNLFSANAIVFVLQKMLQDYGFKRLQAILPTGGQGTLQNYYLTEKDHIFAKTGTLSNQVALSGYLITNKNRLLLFSVLVGNHQGKTSNIRKAVAAFLKEVKEKW